MSFILERVDEIAAIGVAQAAAGLAEDADAILVASDVAPSQQAALVTAMANAAVALVQAP